MKVIILCGGLGTRLKEETEFKPKPMVLVGGKPILWHIMKQYSAYGYNEFILALGYKADYIKNYFLNQKFINSDFNLDTKLHKVKFISQNTIINDNFKITFADTGLETLPGERVLKCKKFIPIEDKHFMLTYGDGVSNIDIKKAFAFHKKQNTLGTICAVHPRSKFGLLEINGDKIFNLDEKPVLKDWVNGGYMFFKRSALKYFTEGETERAALKELIKIKQLSAFKHNDFWYCVDTYRELEELNEIWNSGNPPPWVVWK
jgi:glucose-1-phosphate cytidylyltransferase